VQNLIMPPVVSVAPLESNLYPGKHKQENPLQRGTVNAISQTA
jgi:hypothetical protein